MKDRALKKRPDLFPEASTTPVAVKAQTEQLTRLDIDEGLRKAILPFCRLKMGDVWSDPVSGHRVAVMDATDAEAVKRLVGREKVIWR